MTEPLEQLLYLHEGLRNKPYHCTSGKLTIGVGRNLEDRGITDEEAAYLLRNDIADMRQSLDKTLDWFAGLDVVRRDCLTDMAFNLGLAGLSKFRKMLAAVGAGLYMTAAVEMLDSRWARQVGARAERLALMMETGQYPDAIERERGANGLG